MEPFDRLKKILEQSPTSPEPHEVAQQMLDQMEIGEQLDLLYVILPGWVSSRMSGLYKPPVNVTTKASAPWHQSWLKMPFHGAEGWVNWPDYSLTDARYNIEQGHKRIASVQAHIMWNEKIAATLESNGVNKIKQLPKGVQAELQMSAPKGNTHG